MSRQLFVSYLRVSTQRQGTGNGMGTGYGLDSQRKTIQEFVGSGDVIGEYVEVESGKLANRPMLKKAVRDCKLKGAVLIVAKLDRLSRNQRFLLELQESGIQIRFCDYPSADKMVIGIMAAVAEGEAKLISDRTRRALAAAKARGVKLGTNNLTPDGTKKGVENSVVTRQEIARTRAMEIMPIIQEIRERGVHTLTGIAMELNAIGIGSPRGGRFYPQTVKNVLRYA